MCQYEAARLAPEQIEPPDRAICAATGFCVRWQALIGNSSKDIGAARRRDGGQPDATVALAGEMTAAAQATNCTDAADWVRHLRLIAFLDEGGLALDGALKTLESISNTDSPLKKTTQQ
jgi:hypothetical protein